MGILREVQDENARLKQQWLEDQKVSPVDVAEFAKGVKEVLHNVRNSDYISGFMFKVSTKGKK